jgi:acylaminoacyl-peptidase
VNYRGSTGFGQDSIESLLGRIGTNDVHDMVFCTQELLKNLKLSSIDRYDRN